MKRAPSPVLTLAAGLVALLVAAAAAAQRDLPTRETMPDEVVLVVKDVGDSRVEPTTGVVVGRGAGGAGLVVVPSRFVDEDTRLFVMDGGTELRLDGLPARIVKRSDESGLAVLAVDGLERRPVRVTFNPPPTDHEVRLAAWPPAEMMAEGALPFFVPVDVAGKVTSEAQTLVPGESVPNLTGPLVDLCGQWAGFVIASGEPGIDAAQPPRVILNDELLRIAETMDITLRLESCMQVSPVGGVVAPTVAAPAGAPAGAGDGNPGAGSGFQQMLEDANLGRGALVFLLSALVSGLVFWYLVKRRAATQRRRKIQRTLATETVTFSSGGLPTRRTEPPSPTVGTQPTRPTGSAGWLRIEGTHADGRPLRAVTALDDAKFQAVIGRAGVQLAVDGPGISRKHAVIVGDGGRMTLSDLGSRNGTFVNGVRCQQDEIFVIKEGDKILLGAAEITVRMAPAKGPVA